MIIKRITVIILILLVTSYVILRLPSDFHRSYSAVKFRFGDSEYIESVNVELDGKIVKDFFLYKSFIGTLSYNGNNILDEYADHNEVLIDMEEQSSVLGSGIMIHQQGRGITMIDWPWIGNVMFSDDKDDLAITVAEDGGWNKENGLIIVGPATNHNEALEVLDIINN